MTTHRKFSLGYRSDIEGLRAVAILLVVAAHADVPHLAGGFIGVDVFFVLSGYLITGILVQEASAAGGLDFARFYVRRLRRLLPAMLTMLGVTGLLGYLLLPPMDQLGQSVSAASAAVWLSNFHFAFGDTDYFSEENKANLFLHTWSLGVEEQFYLLWPLLIALSFTVSGGALSSRKRRINGVLLATFILSLALCLYWTRHAPLTAFYMMPSRAWQFALGALVFLQSGSQTGGGTSPRKAILGWMGLIVILVSALFLDHGVSYPGAWALLPSFGAAAVLLAAAVPAGPALLLSNRVMESVGHISYSWYLWHWPILLLGAAAADTNSAVIRSALVALSLLLAIVSYRYVETPIRHDARLLAKPGMAIFAAVALMVLSSSFALQWNGAASTRVKNGDQQRYQSVRSDVSVIYAMGCDDWYTSARVKVCAFGNESAKYSAVIIGDSIGLQWFPAYARVFNKPDWRLLVITKSSCPMVDEPTFYERIGREYTECTQWRRDALKTIRSIKPDIVILGSTDTYVLSETQWRDGTRRILESLSGSVGQIYVMRSTPLLPFDGLSCIARLSPEDHSRSSCTAPLAATRGDDVFGWLHAAAGGIPNVRLIDMTENVCPERTCRAELDGLVVYRDRRHLTTAFVESLAPILESRLHIE